MPKKAHIHPHFGCTEAHLRAQIRSALRKVWRNSAWRVHLESVRFPYKGKTGRGKWGVKCVHCGRVMGYSEKEHRTKLDGSKTKEKRLVYEVNHKESNSSFTNFQELGDYARTMLYGELEVLCWQCHARVTRTQAARKFKVES